MFVWSPKIYMDDKVKKHPMKYRKLVEKKKTVGNCYLLTLPMNEKNSLDIFSSREFWFQYYHEKRLTIVGMAASKASAVELLCRMTEDIYTTYGEVDAKRFHDFFLGA